MKTAKELLFDLVDAIPDGKRTGALFAEDGALELPFLHTLGIEPRHVGPAAVAGFYDVLVGLYPDFKFSPENTEVLIETPDRVYAEYSNVVTAAATSRRVKYSFTALLIAENGKIKLLRESLNVLSAARAVLPNGLADLPVFGDEIESVRADYRMSV